MALSVTLDLYATDGRPLGSLPAFDVESPWWSHTGPVVAAALRVHGVDVRVLRLVSGVPGPPHPVYGQLATWGGRVTYAAETVGPLGDVALWPPIGPDDDHPLRAIWARPGGTDRIVAAVDGLLVAAGRPRTGPVRQERSWNLSSILEVPTADGAVWAKSVPPFFAHEGRVVTCLAPVAPPGLLPRLVGADPATRTVVLDDVPGEDGYAADHETVGRMIDLLVALQARTVAMVDRLLAAGAPDWRAGALAARLDRLVARSDVAATVSPADHAHLTTLVSELPDRLAALAGCGMPDTLVHGDCHPGNWRVDGRALTLLDWGDAGVGHPLLDTAAATTFAEDDDDRDRLLDRFVSAWRRHLPRADPATALPLARPIAALRQALIYRMLCDGVEPAERVHHEQDVGHWLRRAVAEDRATAGARPIRVRRR